MFQFAHFPASLFSWLLFSVLLPDDLAVNPGLNPLAVFYLVFYHGLSLVTVFVVEKFPQREKDSETGAVDKGC